ncbi:MAG: hypothetical protein MI861_14725, partial [Pirellulales bacterium]|nr:hypothetical protein [Pirellulales bacterium]
MTQNELTGKGWKENKGRCPCRRLQLRNRKNRVDGKPPGRRMAKRRLLIETRRRSQTAAARSVIGKFQHRPSKGSSLMMKKITVLGTCTIALIIAMSYMYAAETITSAAFVSEVGTENVAVTADGMKYQPIGGGIRWLVKSDVFLKTLVEESNYGNGDVEVAELHIPKVPK